MARRELQLIQQDFSGGLNTRDPQNRIADNEAVSIDNCLFGDYYTGLKKRGGTSKFNTATISSSDPIKSLFMFTKTDGTYDKWLCVCNGTLYESGVGTWSSVGALSNDDPCSFLQWDDICYIANGTDYKQYDGTTLSNVAGSPPSCKYQVFHKERIYVCGDPANPNKASWCDTGDPTTWDANSYINIKKDDGDKLTGLAVSRDNLLFYKNNSVWALSGTPSTYEAFFLSQLSEEIGCIAPKSLVSYKDVHIFLAHDGVYMYSSGFTLLSDKIGTLISGMSNALNSCAAIHKSVYWLGYNPSGASANEEVLTFDTRLSAWARLKNINASVLALDGSKDLFYGDSTDGFLWQAEDGLDDDGTDIDTYFKGKSFSLGGVGYKLIKRVGLSTDLADSQQTVTLLADSGEKSRTFIFTPLSTIARWGSAVWGVDKWPGGSGKQRWKSVPTGMNGVEFQFEIQESSSYNWELRMLGLSFVQRGPGYRRVD